MAVTASKAFSAVIVSEELTCIYNLNSDLFFPHELKL